MDELSFLDKDYERKINFLTQQFSRMWTRFNIFVTIESSLVGGKLFFDPKNHNPGFAALGIVLSLIWYVFGANDKHLVDMYRQAVKDAGDKLILKVPHDSSYPNKGDYHFVGDIYKHPEVKTSFLSWRTKGESITSVTHLAALFPFVLTIAWIGYLIAILFFLKC